MKAQSMSRAGLGVISLVLAGVGFATILSLGGCGRKGDTYGNTIVGRDLTPVAALLRMPADFEGKTVTVQGRIVRECPSGCWFEIKQDAAIVFVDINPSGFAIPQEIGKTVIVEGTVAMRDNRPILIGKGVEIR